MSSSILVFAEQRSGVFKKAAWEAVSAAHEVAAKMGASVTALVVGHGVEGLCAELGKYGAGRVLVADHPDLTQYATESYCQVLEEAVKKEGSQTIFLAATAMGRDLSARLAARLKAGLASDATHVHFSGSLTVTRPIFSGKAFQKLTFTSAVQVVTLRPNVFKVKESGGNASVEKLSVSLKPARAKVREVAVSTGKKVELSEADIIVSGGRGLKGPENWSLLTDLADALGAAHGATRAVVDAGWRPHEEQVGQTGKTVSPNLYIACGISGAIQHLAGMSSSKYIVAINSDAEAPIFKISDYGIVGDALEVLPALTAAVQKLRSQ